MEKPEKEDNKGGTEENKNRWQWLRMKARTEASGFKILEKKVGKENGKPSFWQKD